MNALPLTDLYAGILGIIMLLLAMRVSGERMKHKASLSIDGEPWLLVSVRRFGNFVEWVPYAMLLMALAEFNGLSAPYLHAAGGFLVLGRLIHPFGVRHNVIPHPLRAIGAGLSFLVILCLSGYLVISGAIKLSHRNYVSQIAQNELKLGVPLSSDNENT